MTPERTERGEDRRKADAIVGAGIDGTTTHMRLWDGGGRIVVNARGTDRRVAGARDTKGSERCGSVHMTSGTQCVAPNGHEGEHYNGPSYWPDVEGVAPRAGDTSRERLVCADCRAVVATEYPPTIHDWPSCHPTPSATSAGPDSPTVDLGAIGGETLVERLAKAWKEHYARGLGNDAHEVLEGDRNDARFFLNAIADEIEANAKDVGDSRPAAVANYLRTEAER